MHADAVLISITKPKTGSNLSHLVSRIGTVKLEIIRKYLPDRQYLVSLSLWTNSQDLLSFQMSPDVLLFSHFHETLVTMKLVLK